MSDEITRNTITEPVIATNTPVVTTEAGTTNEPAPFAWPDQWRAKIAGEDPKEIARLERFKEPADIYKSYRQLENKLATGALKSTTPFPDKGTADDQSAWRKEHGIPESADKYELKLPDGVVIGEEDRPIIDSFLKDAHAGNMTPEVVNQGLSWYYKNQIAAAEARTTLDKHVAKENNEKLRQDWGSDYQSNLQYINDILGDAGDDLRNSILNSRSPDGNPLASNPEFLNFLVRKAREINPIPTMVGQGATSTSVDNEIQTIKAEMAQKNSDYWKNSQKQKRYQDLIQARDRLVAKK
jgi:hypothetical protein